MSHVENVLEKYAKKGIVKIPLEDREIIIDISKLVDAIYDKFYEWKVYLQRQINEIEDNKEGINNCLSKPKILKLLNNEEQFLEVIFYATLHEILKQNHMTFEQVFENTASFAIAKNVISDISEFTSFATLRRIINTVINKYIYTNTVVIFVSPEFLSNIATTWIDFLLLSQAPMKTESKETEREEMKGKPLAPELSYGGENTLKAVGISEEFKFFIKDDQIIDDLIISGHLINIFRNTISPPSVIGPVFETISIEQDEDSQCLHPIHILGIRKDVFEILEK